MAERFLKVITATPNEPGRFLTESDVLTLRAMAARNRGRAQVVVADGDGRFRVLADVPLTPMRGADVENDPELRARATQAAIDQLDAAARSTASEGGHLDAVGLFEYVSRVPGEAVVSIATSGLQDDGPLAVDELTWDGVGADATIRAAGERGLIPSLVGKQITVAGAGDVAGPQTPLPEMLRQRVRDHYLLLCEAGDAKRCVADDVYAGGQDSVARVPVPTVAVPELDPLVVAAVNPQCTDFALPSDLTFGPSSAEPLPGVREQAMQIGQLLAEACDVTLVGRTATVGSAESSRTLSRLRAEAIGAAMVEGGFPPERLRVRGVGFDDPIVADRGPDGRLIPAAAQRNRSVSFVLTARRG